MRQPTRILTAANIDTITNDFRLDLDAIGKSIEGKTGLPLLVSLKRERLGIGPYPDVSLFEAANRIMSDLVILHGVAGLLKAAKYPFDAYTVEFGNENRNDFDIQARSPSERLVGEAFNVAPSFFNAKKAAAIKKLRKRGADAAYRIIMFNADACASTRTLQEVDIDHVRVEVSIERFSTPRH